MFVFISEKEKILLQNKEREHSYIYIFNWDYSTVLLGNEATLFQFSVTV